jgi:hypothetical protein
MFRCPGLPEVFPDHPRLITFSFTPLTFTEKEQTRLAGKRGERKISLVASESLYIQLFFRRDIWVHGL